MALKFSYFFTNFGDLSNNPNKSSVTNICPSHLLEAPIPITGILEILLILFANFSVTDSKTTEKVLEDPNEEYYKKSKFYYSGKKKADPKISFKGPSKKTVLITGDVESPEDYYLLWDNKNSYERNNVSIWRPKCPLGYESMSDVAIHGFDKPKNNNNIKKTT